MLVLMIGIRSKTLPGWRFRRAIATCEALRRFDGNINVGDAVAWRFGGSDL
jgi:hypothetical protein